MVRTSKAFKIGDLVWAKMKGYSPWPGRITEAPKKKNSKIRTYVYFFGTENEGWVLTKDVYPYVSYKSEFSEKLKTAVFKKAVEQIKECYNNYKKEGVLLAKNSSSDEDIPLNAVKKMTKRPSFKLNGVSNKIKTKSKRAKSYKNIITVKINDEKAVKDLIPNEIKIILTPCKVNGAQT